jgi:hypothetical protein
MYCNEMSGFGESIYDHPNRTFFQAVRGKPTMKSIVMSSHFHMGIDRGWITPADFKWLPLRKFGLVSLIEDDLLNFWINGDHKAFPKADHILVIFLETSIPRVSLF